MKVKSKVQKWKAIVVASNGVRVSHGESTISQEKAAKVAIGNIQKFISNFENERLPQNKENEQAYKEAKEFRRKYFEDYVSESRKDEYEKIDLENIASS